MLSPSDSTILEAFLQRWIPAYLQEGAPVPDNWVVTTVAWNSLRQQAEDFERGRLTKLFAHGLALKLTFEEMMPGVDIGEFHGSDQGWNVIRQLAEDFERERLAVEFVKGVVAWGFTPQEMATGILQDGSKMPCLSCGRPDGSRA